MLFAALDRFHLKRRILCCVDYGVYLVLGFKLELLIVFSVETSREFCASLALEHGVKQPVFLAVKASYLVFAVNDHARCNRLHSAGRKAAADLFPKQRRELIADKAVEQSARLLCIDKIVVDITGLIDAVGNYFFGYLVECDASCSFVGKRKQLF